MPTVAELADTYHALQAKQTELDQRIINLPDDDDDRDILMSELEPVLSEMHDAVHQLSRVRAHDVAALRSKAAVIIGISRDDPDALALAISLAYDVADVLGSS
jgi:hypothetical protein